MDEVEHVIEGTAGISTAQWCSLRVFRTRHAARSGSGMTALAGIHQRLLLCSVLRQICWGPSPCTRLSVARTMTAPPPHRAAIDRRRVRSAVSQRRPQRGTDSVWSSSLSMSRDGFSSASHGVLNSSHEGDHVEHPPGDSCQDHVRRGDSRPWLVPTTVRTRLRRRAERSDRPHNHYRPQQQ